MSQYNNDNDMIAGVIAAVYMLSRALLSQVSVLSSGFCELLHPIHCFPVAYSFCSLPQVISVPLAWNRDGSARLFRDR